MRDAEVEWSATSRPSRRTLPDSSARIINIIRNVIAMNLLPQEISRVRPHRVTSRMFITACKVVIYRVILTQLVTF